MRMRGRWELMELVPTDIRRGHRPGSSLVARVVAIGVVAFAGCVRTDHFLIYSPEAPPQVVLWQADFAREGLLIHIEGARPPGAGPFPTVIVHPEEEETAVAMHGVIWNLAAHGYVAIAADYERFLHGKYRRTTFAWRSAVDIRLPIDVTLSYPEVDPNRLGAIGFSEGAVLSLLMAAHYPEQFKAVVAYYPITDFPH